MPTSKHKVGQVVRVNPTTIQTIRSEKYVEAYTNNSETGMSPWDCRIRFSKLTEVENRKIVLEDQATIIMSLQHAKALAVSLLQSIKQYEAENGTLAIPAVAAQAEERNIAKPVETK